MSEVTDFLFIDEAKIQGYGESDSSGKWIKLEVHNLDSFRGRKGAHVELAIKLVNNDGTAGGDDGTQLKGGAICKDAALLCRNGDFQAFCHHMIPERLASEENAKHYLLEFCGIESRRELDHSEPAANQFRAMFKAYGEWVKQWR